MEGEHFVNGAELPAEECKLELLHGYQYPSSIFRLPLSRYVR